MQFSEHKPTTKQKVIGILLAVATGLFGSLTPVAPIMTTFLYAYAGTPAFLVCVILQAMMCNLSGGMVMSVICLLGSVLPAALVTRGVRLRMPFFEQLKRSLIWQGVGLLGSVLVLYAYMGSDIIGQFMESMRAQLEAAGAQSPYIAQMVDNLLVQMYGAETMQQALTDTAERARYLNAMMNDMQDMMALSLPGMLVSNAMIAGVLMVVWPNWYYQRRGCGTETSYVAVDKWRVPGNIVLGMFGLYAVGLALYLAGLSNGGPVFLTVQSIFNVCFCMQAAGAVARQMAMFRVSEKKRRVALCVLLAALWFTGNESVLVWVGCASALCGSHGLITEALRRYREKHKDD